MAFYDNLTEDQRQRLLLGLGARMWAGSLQGQRTGQALAGGILGGLEDYSQITAEARRAKLEQQTIERNERALEREQAESDAWRNYDLEVKKATTPEGRGLALQSLGSSIRRPEYVEQGIRLPIEAGEIERKQAVPGLVQSLNYATQTGDKRGIAATLGELAAASNDPNLAMQAARIRNPAREDVVTIDGHKVLRKTDPMTGAVSYERVPWTPTDLEGLGLGLGGAKPAEAAPPSEPEKPGLLDRFMNQFSAGNAQAQRRATLPQPAFPAMGLGAGMAPPAPPPSAGLGMQIQSTDPKIQAGQAVAQRVNEMLAAGGKPPPNELQAAIEHARYIGDQQEERRLANQYRFIYGGR